MSTVADIVSEIENDKIHFVNRMAELLPKIDVASTSAMLLRSAADMEPYRDELTALWDALASAARLARAARDYSRAPVFIPDLNLHINAPVTTEAVTAAANAALAAKHTAAAV